MRILFSSDFEKRLKKITKSNNKLIDQIENKIILYESNVNHPSLRLHRLTGKQKDFWSISVDKKIRIIVKLVDDVAYFVDIGTHDEVYK